MAYYQKDLCMCVYILFLTLPSLMFTQLTGSCAPGHHHSKLRPDKSSDLTKVPTWQKFLPDKSSPLTYVSVMTTAGERREIAYCILSVSHITSAHNSFAKISHTVLLPNYKLQKSRDRQNYSWPERWKTRIFVNYANDKCNSNVLSRMRQVWE